MDRPEAIQNFYLEHIPEAKIEDNILKAPCPFCGSEDRKGGGNLVAYLDPESFFMGYFRCLNRCRPGGFAPHFARLLGIDAQEVPGYDPDREIHVRAVVYPSRNVNNEVKKFRTLMGESEYAHFNEFGVSRGAVEELRIGYNGRYLVYP